jgi:hypothetical protein
MKNILKKSKLKWMILLLMAFLFIGCEGGSTEPSVTENLTTEAPVTTESSETTASTDGTYVLEYPEGSEELTGEIGSSVVIPELLKDDYIFIGWSDGTDYYAGLTEFVEGRITLTPEYLPIESVFERIEVFMGQATLVNYNGESNIVGVPTYWNDMLIVGFNSSNLDITKLYLPSSLQIDGYLSLDYFTDLTDLIIHGDEQSLIYNDAMPQANLEEYIEDCTYIDGGSIDLDNLSPGLLNEGCEIHSIIRRNDEEAVTVPGLGTFYTFAVMLNSNTFIPGAVSPDLKNISFDHSIGLSLFDWFGMNQLSSLEHISFSSEDIFMIEDNQLYYDYEGEQYLGYVYSNDDVLELNSDTVNIIPDQFYVGGDVEEINLINYDDMVSIDGIVYEMLDDSEMKLIVYPNGNQDTSFTFPSNMTEIRHNVYNEYVETITINDYFEDISTLMTYNFPNIKNIHVPEGHPELIEEDGVIYDDTKTYIYFINESVQDLVVQDTVMGFRPFRPLTITPSLGYQSLDSIHLNEGVQADFIMMSMNFFDYNTLTVDENNPNIKARDGMLYNGDYTEILYIENDITSLVIQDEVEVIRYYFGYFDSLESVHLNQHIDTSILYMLFRSSSLERITIDENNPYMMAKDNVVYSKDETTLFLVPANLDIDVFTVPEDVLIINSGAFYSNTHIEAFVVEENNPYYQSIDGIIYEDVYRISTPWFNRLNYIPLNYQSTSYTMPDDVTSIIVSFHIDHLSDFLASLESIDIGPNYEFTYDYMIYGNYTFGNADPLTSLLYLVDVIHIDPESPYYDEDYHIIKTLETNVLLAFTGDDTSYEVPDYIEVLSQYLFYSGSSIEHITLQSSIKELPLSIFEVEALESITIKGNDVLNVEGMTDDEALNDIGPTYIYKLNSADLIIYVDAEMVETYQNHPFWSLYDIRAIE